MGASGLQSGTSLHAATMNDGLCVGDGLAAGTITPLLAADGPDHHKQQSATTATNTDGNDDGLSIVGAVDGPHLHVMTAQSPTTPRRQSSHSPVQLAPSSTTSPKYAKSKPATPISYYGHESMLPVFDIDSSSDDEVNAMSARITARKPGKTTLSAQRADSNAAAKLEAQSASSIQPVASTSTHPLPSNAGAALEQWKMHQQPQMLFPVLQSGIYQSNLQNQQGTSSLSIPIPSSFQHIAYARDTGPTSRPAVLAIGSHSDRQPQPRQRPVQRHVKTDRVDGDRSGTPLPNKQDGDSPEDGGQERDESGSTTYALPSGITCVSQIEARPFRDATGGLVFPCPICEKQYTGKHARSIWKRHLSNKHDIPLNVQPRRTRWDNDINRPKDEAERHKRTLESKRRWAAKNRAEKRVKRRLALGLAPDEEDLKIINEVLEEHKAAMQAEAEAHRREEQVRGQSGDQDLPHRNEYRPDTVSSVAGNGQILTYGSAVTSVPRIINAAGETGPPLQPGFVQNSLQHSTLQQSEGVSLRHPQPVHPVPFLQVQAAESPSALTPLPLTHQLRYSAMSMGSVSPALSTASLHPPLEYSNLFQFSPDPHRHAIFPRQPSLQVTSDVHYTSNSDSGIPSQSVSPAMSHFSFAPSEADSALHYETFMPDFSRPLFQQDYLYYPSQYPQTSYVPAYSNLQYPSLGNAEPSFQQHTRLETSRPASASPMYSSSNLQSAHAIPSPYPVSPMQPSFMSQGEPEHGIPTNRTFHLHPPVQAPGMQRAHSAPNMLVSPLKQDFQPQNPNTLQLWPATEAATARQHGPLLGVPLNAASSHEDVRQDSAIPLTSAQHSDSASGHGAVFTDDGSQATQITHQPQPQESAKSKIPSGPALPLRPASALANESKTDAPASHKQQRLPIAMRRALSAAAAIRSEAEVYRIEEARAPSVEPDNVQYSPEDIKASVNQHPSKLDELENATKSLNRNNSKAEAALQLLAMKTSSPVAAPVNDSGFLDSTDIFTWQAPASPTRLSTKAGKKAKSRQKDANHQSTPLGISTKAVNAGACFPRSSPKSSQATRVHRTGQERSSDSSSDGLCQPIILKTAADASQGIFRKRKSEQTRSPSSRKSGSGIRSPEPTKRKCLPASSEKITSGHNRPLLHPSNSDGNTITLPYVATPITKTTRSQTRQHQRKTSDARNNAFNLDTSSRPSAGLGFLSSPGNFIFSSPEHAAVSRSLGLVAESSHMNAFDLDIFESYSGGLSEYAAGVFGSSD